MSWLASVRLRRLYQDAGRSERPAWKLSDDSVHAGLG
jgi:hypothetical protein